MAEDKKISQLTLATTPLAGTEEIEIIQGGVNKRVAVSEVGGGAVDSVNGETGVVVLDAADVGAEPTLAAASETVAGKAELATQAETNTGTDDARIVTPLKLANYTGVTNKQLLVNSATALTDASSMDLTAIKHTLTTSSATRTFTISYTGDDITLIVTLNTTATVFTFPATSLCISEGIASGDNTCSITAVSGDKIAIAIKKVGSAYYVVAKNFGQ